MEPACASTGNGVGAACKHTLGLAPAATVALVAAVFSAWPCYHHRSELISHRMVSAQCRTSAGCVFGNNPTTARCHSAQHHFPLSRCACSTSMVSCGVCMPSMGHRLSLACTCRCASGGAFHVSRSGAAALPAKRHLSPSSHRAGRRRRWEHKKRLLPGLGRALCNPHPLPRFGFDDV